MLPYCCNSSLLCRAKVVLSKEPHRARAAELHPPERQSMSFLLLLASALTYFKIHHESETIWYSIQPKSFGEYWPQFHLCVHSISLWPIIPRRQLRHPPSSKKLSYYQALANGEVLNMERCLEWHCAVRATCSDRRRYCWASPSRRKIVSVNLRGDPLYSVHRLRSYLLAARQYNIVIACKPVSRADVPFVVKT